MDSLTALHTRIISTHTLTWSVTRSIYSCNVATIYFNSHAHVERDKCFSLNAWERTNFNSHAHVERDSFMSLSVFADFSFQLTRSRGA